MSREVDEADLFDKKSFAASRWTWALALLVLVLTLVEWFGVGSFWPGLLMLLIAIAVGVIAYYMPRLTQSGADVFEALKRQMSRDNMNDRSNTNNQSILLEEPALWQLRLDEILSGALLPKSVKHPRRGRDKSKADE